MRTYKLEPLGMTNNYIPAGPIRSLHDGHEPGQGMVISYRAALGASGQTRQIGKLRPRGPTRQIGALGAVGLPSTATSGTTFNYRAAAENLASNMLAMSMLPTFVVVSLDVDGKNPVVTSFNDRDDATDAFEAIYNAPGQRAYALLYQRGEGVISDQHFAATRVFETRFTFEKLKSAAPWIIAGVVAIGGLIYYAKKKPGVRHRARARVRGAIARARRSRR